MSSKPQESFSPSMFWNVESNSYDQVVTYPGHMFPGLGTPVSFECLPHVSLADEALTMSPFNYSERPLDAPTISMHPFVIRPPIEAVTERGPELPVYSLPMVSASGDLVLSESWSGLHSGVHSAMAPSSWTVSSQELPEFPAVEGNSCGTPPLLSMCLGMAAPVAAMSAKADTYDPRFYSGNIPHRPVHMGREYRSSSHQLGERATRDRGCRPTCPVAGCGKSFSGQSEKNRHIRSKHLLPTIGCRKCNYKQSRKDLFRAHCKKHHSRESLEDLIVRLVAPST